MAHTFRIFFIGLICHIGKRRNKKQYAALLKSDDHIPLLIFEDAVVAPVIAKRLSFDGLTEGDALTDKLFDSYVPSLTEILGGTLKPDVANESLHDVAIYMRYPQGFLSVVDLYGQRARHRVDDEETREGCVARMSVLTATTDEPTVTVNLKGFDILEGELSWTRTISSDSCVLILNTSRDIVQLVPEIFSNIVTTFATDLPARAGRSGTTPAAPHLHQEHGHGAHAQQYERLLNGAGQVTVEDSGSCDDHVTPGQCARAQNVLALLIERGVFTVMHSECGNTDYP